MSQKKIITIIGPTASGKTDIAIALTQQFPMEIISVDSAMVYRDMDIGTGKPLIAELAIAPHRLINICNPTDFYSAGQFCLDAMREIKTISDNKKTPLLVGGTMLYFHKLFYGLAELPTADASTRQQIEVEAKEMGWEKMHEILAKSDPIAASKIKPQDPQRISRALEVFRLTGKKISDLQKDNMHFINPDDALIIALIPSDRAWLHNRIKMRFEKMLENGLIDEVEKIKKMPGMQADLPAMRMVGYRQVLSYLNGEIDFETMKHKAIVATRQLAKRQLTWLRSWEKKIVVDPCQENPFESILKIIQMQLSVSAE